MRECCDFIGRSDVYLTVTRLPRMEDTPMTRAIKRGVFNLSKKLARLGLAYAHIRMRCIRRDNVRSVKVRHSDR
jgi:hypothetical protein